MEKNSIVQEELMKKLLMDLGADVCGISNISRFTGAPEGFSPLDIYPECKSLIVFGVALPKGLSNVDARLVYGHFNTRVCNQVDEIAFQAAKMLEKKWDVQAVPMPCDSPYEYWDEKTLTGRGLMSMKHAAVLAGIGAMGKSTLLLNPQYGNQLTIGAILTNLDLKSDPFCENICIDSCTRCIDLCPSGAISEYYVDQQLCRLHTYNKTKRGFDTVDCNQCRMGCPMRFGKEK